MTRVSAARLEGLTGRLLGGGRNQSSDEKQRYCRTSIRVRVHLISYDVPLPGISKTPIVDDEPNPQMARAC